MNHRDSKKSEIKLNPMDGRQRREQDLYRLATRLFWLPAVVAIPVFFLVSETIPEVTGGISDGFRKLNVGISILFFTVCLCWSISLAIVVFIEIPKVPQSRVLLWIGSLGLLATIVVLLMALGL